VRHARADAHPRFASPPLSHKARGDCPRAATELAQRAGEPIEHLHETRQYSRRRDAHLQLS